MPSFSPEDVKTALEHMHDVFLKRAAQLDDRERNENHLNAHDAYWKASDMTQLLQEKLLREAHGERPLLGQRGGSEELQYQIARLRAEESKIGYPEVMVLLRQGLEELADGLGIPRPEQTPSPAIG